MAGRRQLHQHPSPPPPSDSPDDDDREEEAIYRMGPVRSVGGWVVFVTGLHEEATEDDILDLFSEYGNVTSVKMNSDRRTGHAKGYALVEFEQKLQAQDAINSSGKEYMGKTIKVDWAFVQSTGPPSRIP